MSDSYLVPPGERYLDSEACVVKSGLFFLHMNGKCVGYACVGKNMQGV